MAEPTFDHKYRALDTKRTELEEAAEIEQALNHQTRADELWAESYKISDEIDHLCASRHSAVWSLIQTERVAAGLPRTF